MTPREVRDSVGLMLKTRRVDCPTEAVRVIFRRKQLLNVYHRADIWEMLTLAYMFYFFSLLVLYVDVESDFHAKVPVVVCKDRKRSVTMKRK